MSKTWRKNEVKICSSNWFQCMFLVFETWRFCLLKNIHCTKNSLQVCFLWERCITGIPWVFFCKHLYCNHFVTFSVVDKELTFFTSYKNCFVLKNFKVRPFFKAKQASSLCYETTNNRFILIFKCIRLST